MTEIVFKKLCTDYFTKLFKKAKATNEKQFVTSFFVFFKFPNYSMISYVNDYEFRESLQFLNFFLPLLKRDDIDNKTKTRIRMMLYCHIIEVDTIYIILFNMIRTIQNRDYSSIIVYTNKKGKLKEMEYPHKKIELLIKESSKIGIPFEKIYSEFYLNYLRNAFVHSQYFLDKNGNFNISKHMLPKNLTVSKKPKKKIHFRYDEIEVIFQKTLDYLESFINVYNSFNDAYKDGNSYETNFGRIRYYKDKHNWSFDKNK